MMIGTPSEELLAGVIPEGVDSAEIDHRLQRPVHGGEPDPLPGRAQLRVHVLGGDENLLAVEELGDRLALPRRTNT